MTNVTKSLHIKKTIRLMLAAMALVAGMFAVSPGGAVAAPASQVAPALQAEQPISPAASWSCRWSATSHRVDANCTVYSGYLRMWGTCSNGRTYYTPWVGRGSWHLWVTCGSYRLLRFGFQDAG